MNNHFARFGMILLTAVAFCDFCSAVDTQHTAEGDFAAIFDPIAEIAPADRNYPEILAEIEKFCKLYPESAATRRALMAVSKWESKGLITKSAAAPLLSLQPKEHPAEMRLRSLDAEIHRATVDEDMAKLKKIAEELRDIKAKYPAGVADLTASAALVTVCYEGKFYADALQAAEAFLEKWGDGSAGLPGQGQYIHTVSFLRARMIARTISAESGVEAYEEIADKYAADPATAFAAIYGAGQVAMDGKRYVTALKQFQKLTERFRGDPNERLIIAQFQISRCQFLLGQEEEAKATLMKVVKDHSGTDWESQALQHLKALNDPRTAAAIRGDLDQLNTPSKDTPPSKESTTVRSPGMFRMFIAANVGLVIIGVALYAVRRKLTR